MMDLFVGGISIDATTDEAKASITEQGVDVVEMEILHRYNNTQCFRLRIRKSDYEKILDPGFWPAGISVRRFWHRRAKRDNDNNGGGVGNNVGGGGSGSGGGGSGSGGGSGGGGGDGREERDHGHHGIGAGPHNGGDEPAGRLAEDSPEMTSAVMAPPILASEGLPDGSMAETSAVDVTAVKTPPISIIQ